VSELGVLCDDEANAILDMDGSGEGVICVAVGGAPAQAICLSSNSLRKPRSRLNPRLQAFIENQPEKTYKSQKISQKKQDFVIFPLDIREESWYSSTIGKVGKCVWCFSLEGNGLFALLKTAP
jgi:hypothetical protein